MKLGLLRRRLEAYLRAEREVLERGQEVTIEGLRITRANISDLRAMINSLDSAIHVEELSRKPRLRYVIPR